MLINVRTGRGDARDGIAVMAICNTLSLSVMLDVCVYSIIDTGSMDIVITQAWQRIALGWRKGRS